MEPVPDIKIVDEYRECVIGVNKLMLTMLSATDHLPNIEHFYGKMDAQFERDWIPKIVNHGLLLRDRVLERLVMKLKIKPLLYQYRVYASRFQAFPSVLCHGTFLNFKMKDRLDINIYIPELDQVPVDEEVFVETEYLMNNQFTSTSTKFLDFFVHDITAKNSKLFGDREIWNHNVIHDWNERKDEIEGDSRTLFSDALSLDERGFVSAPFMVNKDVVIKVGDHFNCQYDGNWKSAFVSAVFMDKICLRFGERKHFNFVWMKRCGIHENLRISYKGNDEISKFEFGVKVGNGVDDNDYDEMKTFRIEQNEDFKMSIRSVIAKTVDVSKVTIYARPRWNHGDFEWIRLKQWDNPLPNAPKYFVSDPETVHFDSKTKLLPFDTKLGDGGEMEVVSLSDIVIDDEGAIDGSGCGLPPQMEHVSANTKSSGFGRYIGAMDVYEDGAGGGIIRLISYGMIQNDGILRCKGSKQGSFSGGTIVIVANGVFENNGTIDCSETGNVHIVCREYVNHGTVIPKPTIDTLKVHTDFPRNLDILMFQLLARKKRIENKTKFYYNDAGIQFDGEWVSLIPFHALLFQTTRYDGKCVLERLYDELGIKQLKTHYYVYKSRFKVAQTPMCGDSTALKFEPYEYNADNRHFAETEYLFNGRPVSHFTTSVPFIVYKIEARNTKLFGDRIIWREEFPKWKVWALRSNQDPRPQFSDSFVLDTNGTLKVPFAVSEDANFSDNQPIKCYRDGKWMMGSVCTICADQICLKFKAADRCTFEWLKCAEIPKRLRFTYKGEDEVQNLTFSVSTDAEATEIVLKTRQCRFDNIEGLSLPLPSVTFYNKDPQSIYIYAKPNDVKSKFTRIASLENALCFPFGSNYVLNETETICIDERFKVSPYNHQYHSGGDFSLCSKSQIVLTENAHIDGNINELNEDIVETHGSKISLISGDGVTINGAIECKMPETKSLKGGSVYIASDGGFENNGFVDCGANGEICIDCFEFMNNETILPSPTVMIGDSESVKWMIDTLSSLNAEKPIKLSVKKHRGHHSTSYKPSNLLSESGDLYASTGSANPKDDWIVFEQLEDSPFIPTRFIIKNETDSYGIKRIQICGGMNSEDFEEWFQIDYIHNKSSDRQYFPIDTASRHYAFKKQFKFFKLKILENHGNDTLNVFCFFGLMGIQRK